MSILVDPPAPAVGDPWLQAFGEPFPSLNAAFHDPRCVVSWKGLRDRKAKGWTLEDAMSTPRATVGSRTGSTGKLFFAFGERKTMHAWSIDPRCMVTRTGLRQRIDKGQSMEEALQGKPLRNPDFSVKHAHGHSGTLVHLVEVFGNVKYQTVIARRANGLPLEDALTKTTVQLNRAHHAKYEAFGDSKTAAEWAEDERCVHSSGMLIYVRVRKYKMPVEDAIILPNGPVLYYAKGEWKSFEEWAQDQSTALTHRASFHRRIHRAGMATEDAITHPRFEKSSAAEDGLCEFVRNLGVEVVTHDRTVAYPREVDIYLPQHHLAIEYNGVYWHSERYRDRNFHQSKWLACRAAGVQLIQVWQDDYALHPEIVHSMIRHHLGMNPHRVMARNTVVAEEAEAATKAFLEAHHIQGHVSASVYVGLRTQTTGDLVAMCLFKQGPGRRWELTRYATSVSVAGGFTKCLAFFTRNYKWTEIRTFADLCVSNGDLYRKAGFVEDGMIPPDYRYVEDGVRRHKFGYRLDKFRSRPDLLYADGLTERELADLNGLPRVWDAGKMRWVLRPSPAPAN